MRIAKLAIGLALAALPAVVVSSFIELESGTDGTVFADSGPGVDDAPSDVYDLVEARIAAGTLDATVAYGGGCEAHDFTLLVSDAFLPMDPVRVRVDLVHDSNGDPCEAWLTEELSFDLTPIREAYGQARGVIVLLLDNAPDGELRYEF